MMTFINTLINKAFPKGIERATRTINTFGKTVDKLLQAGVEIGAEAAANRDKIVELEERNRTLDAEALRVAKVIRNIEKLIAFS